MSTISVIIPAYNAEKYIGEAIQSALNQTRPAAAVIVVDDACTDGTAQIARSFGDRVTVLVNGQNSGPGHSRNVGVARSTGEYLAFLDADDKWLPNHLETLTSLLWKHELADVVVGSMSVIGTRSYTKRFLPEATEPADVFLILMRSYAIWPSAVMVRRRAFEAVHGFTDDHLYYRGRQLQAEDIDFYLKLALKYLFVSSDIVSGQYRRHPEQSTAHSDEHRLAVFKCKLGFIERIQQQGEAAAVVDKAKERLLRDCEQHLLINGFPSGHWPYGIVANR